ncbi:MAG TPA: DUF2516 family protein [Jiangellaceae bacterium]|nr:DUF2516 family protein [Jiangellaceae bacterium]
MPELFGPFQGLVSSLLWFGALGLAVFGLIDALRVPTDAFPYAGKRTKNLWLALLGIAAAVLLVAGPMNIFGLAAVVASAVYLVDVRPAVKQYRGRRPGTSEGPYGPW